MRFGQALHQAGDADLVDHLGQLAGAASPMRVTAREGHRHRLHRVEGRGVAAAHHGQRAVDRAGLAAGDRRVDEVQAARAAAACSSRATSADAVVWSTKTAPGGHAGQAPCSPR
jgi:hypothetical protein